MTNETVDPLNQFLLENLKATQLLYDNELTGQMLVLLYASIEAMGLMRAPLSVTSATGETFKDWVRTHLLPKGSFHFNDVDLWGARCGVLHTFTSDSDLARKGKARQIQYVSGPRDNPFTKAFFAATLEIDGGIHVPASVEEIYLAYLEAIESFQEEMTRLCAADPNYTKRLRQVLNQHPLGPR